MEIPVFMNNEYFLKFQRTFPTFWKLSATGIFVGTVDVKYMLTLLQLTPL